MTIQSPFNNHSTALDVVQGRDLSGKTALVTGGSSGIGIETARALAQAGAEVILAARDTAKGESVAQELRTSTGNHKIHVLELDLASLASIKSAAETFSQRWHKLHILINNAAVMATPLSYTPDGFEMQFGTNHLGHFALANYLLPALLASAPSRVVAVSSIGHRRSDIVWEDIQYRTRPYDKFEAYSQSKTANILFAVGFNQHYANQGVTANALNPGGATTNLQKHLSREEWLERGYIDADGNLNPLFKSVEQGASTSVWAAVANELEGMGGLYLENCQEAGLWSD
ncbi:MAG: SDR family NAD(P)-dependent oxidoreductase, partial [Chloroflexota bacterium]